MPEFHPTKKRKDLMAKKNWEVILEETKPEVSESECDGPRPSDRHGEDSETPRRQGISTEIRNITAEKLQNTIFQITDSKIITRSAGNGHGTT